MLNQHNVMSEQEYSSQLSSHEFKQKLASLYSYLATHLGIRQSPKVKLINSPSNAVNPFGFTGHYDDTDNSITLYITDRHDTDILRSFAHEIIHHWQNERGTLHQQGTTSANAHYAQENPWLRRREIEAYMFGNILFRDWQDEQRNGPPQTPPTLPQPLDENLMANPAMLKNRVENFVKDLIVTGILKSYHRDKTSGDMQPQDFAKDLSHKLLTAINEWIKTVNDRGNWENDEGGMINERRI